MRLLCSGACRVLGLWATSLCLVPELPCLWPPGIFPTFPFTWSLPVLRSCRTPSGSSPSCCDNLLCHERCLSTLTSWITRVKFQRDGKRRTLGQQFCLILMINPRAHGMDLSQFWSDFWQGTLYPCGDAPHAPQGVLCQLSTSGFAFRVPVLGIL